MQSSALVRLGQPRGGVSESVRAEFRLGAALIEDVIVGRLAVFVAGALVFMVGRSGVNDEVAGGDRVGVHRSVDTWGGDAVRPGVASSAGCAAVMDLDED